MKKKSAIIGASLTVVVISGASLAHDGATGVVRERMDGMVALGDAVRNITPIMRGQTSYDADAVSDFARVIQDHSGDAMTSLFPEGSAGDPSEARETVWSDWEEFEQLALRLEILGRALETASVNGLSAEGETDTSATADMTGTGMSMDSGMGTMMGVGETEIFDLEALSALSSEELFAQVGQTCSACHTKYRAESN